MSVKATKILPSIAPIMNNINYCVELILTEQIRTDNTNINTDSSEKIIEALPAEVKYSPWSVKGYAKNGTKMPVATARIAFEVKGSIILFIKRTIQDSITVLQICQKNTPQSSSS